MRFLHYALFDGKLLSLHYFVVDFAVCVMAVGTLGFRLTRAGQMVAAISLALRAQRPFGWRSDATLSSSPRISRSR